MYLDISPSTRKDFRVLICSATTCCWDRRASGAPLADSAWAVWTVVVRMPGDAGLAAPTGTGRPPAAVDRKLRTNWPWLLGLSTPTPRCWTSIWKSLQRWKKKLWIYFVISSEINLQFQELYIIYLVFNVALELWFQTGVPRHFGVWH